MEASIKRFLSGSGSGDGSGDGSGSGDGYGYGFGSGFGDGSGSGDGYGYGYGFGSGFGDGSGSGAGYGDGYGSGSGDGYGDGSGSGDGYGYGFGSGFGDGSGSGAGYGDGDGDGDGSGYGEKLMKYQGKKVYYIDSIPCVFESVHDNWASVMVINCEDFTTKKAVVAKLDGLFAHGETVRKAFSAVTEKVMDNMDDDEKKRRFLEAFPEYETPYKIDDFFSWHHIVTGSCEFGRKKFAQEHGINLDGEMTVKQFIELTRGSYGGYRIGELLELYKK